MTTTIPQPGARTVVSASLAKRMVTLTLPVKRPTAAHYQRGRSDEWTAVFSCPGRHEIVAKRPIAKVTGTNFELFLAILTGWGFSLPGARADWTVANATTKPLYAKRDGRTEEKRKKVLLRTVNIARLKGDVGHTRTGIICFGDNPSMVVPAAMKTHKASTHPMVIHLPHLSLSRLNREIIVDLSGKAIAPGTNAKECKANTGRRIEVVAVDFLRQVVQRDPTGRGGRQAHKVLRKLGLA